MNNITNFLKTTFLAVGVLSAVSSCVKNDEWENPPIQCDNKFPAPTMSMADFAAQVPASGYKLIQDNQIFDGYIVSSDQQGNFYKTISFQDKTVNPTVGLQIEVDKASNFADFPVGAHIRINAKGLRLGLDRGTVKLGSEDPTFAIGRIPQALVGRYISGVCNGAGLDVQTIVPTQLASLADAKNANLINTLVTIPATQFSLAEVFPTPKKFIDYDAAGQGLDTDRNIEDKLGNSTVIRNSGFFKTGGEQLPNGSGSVTFVVSRYNNNWQMLIRSLSDIKYTDPRFIFDTNPPKGGTAIAYSGNFLENFESYSTSPTNLEVYPKYVNDPVLGNRYWQLKTFSSNKYIQLGANSGTGPYVTYFAVPVDFTTASTFKFDVNVGFWNGNALKVYYTTNYTPMGDITTATKTDITSAFNIPQLPTSGYGTIAPAGTYNIPSSVTGNGFILFEYSGNGSGVTTTIQLDNIQVQ